MYLLIAFAVFVGTSLASDCGDAPATDGCSVYLPFIPFQNTFAPACNKHDVCYSCGDTFDITKEECDDAFLKDLLSHCSSSRCRGWAVVYYKAVDEVGFGYEVPSSSWCRRESWYRTDCLP